VVSLPVRHGKSEYFSYILPAWLLLNNPEKRIILVTHSGRFSELFGNRVKTLISRFQYEGACLDKNYKSRGDFRMAQGGGMTSLGWGGGITGRGGDLILVDDLITDSLQAMSASNREKLGIWLRSDLLTRCEPGASVISVLSRRHPEDPAGLFLGMGWPELKMQALTDGVALWPERYDAQALLNIKSDLECSGQGWIWSCLYQQEPIDPSSVAFPAHFFDNILVPEEPKGGFNIISVDPSKARKSDQKNNDPCGVVVVNINNDNLLTVIDGFSRKISVDRIVDELLILIKQYRPKVVSVETIDLQLLILHELERRLVDEKLIYGTDLRSYEPRGDKHARIELSLTPMLAKSRIKICDKACLRPLITELQQFPCSAHDDYVDSLTQSVWLASKILG